MTERPIIFSGPMVRAILDGRKTQTRRVVKPQPGGRLFHGMDWRWYRSALADDREPVCCPYGAPGDRLWVREAWAADDAHDDLAPRNIPPGGPIWYAEDKSLRGMRGILHMGKMRPSIHMPRWASRLTLEVVSVRVERLQEISEADAKAEGCGYYVGGEGIISESDMRIEPGFWHGPSGYVEAFAQTWDSINGKRAPWESNPWVWAITFRRVE